MARRPARKSRGNPAAAPAKAAAPLRQHGPGQNHFRLLALLSEQPIEQIGLAEIASEAGVSLAQLRGEFFALAIYAAHIKAIDRAVLAEDLSDMAEEPPRERLFDVLMRRLETWRRIVKRFARCCAPPCEIRRLPCAQWHRGPVAAMDADRCRHQCFRSARHGTRTRPRLLFGSVLRTWTHDDEPGLARTMATLDRALARGQRYSGFLDDLCTLPSRLSRPGPRRRRRDRDEDEEAATA